MILFVDDDIYLLDAYVECLEIECGRVETAKSVPGARKILAGKETVDLAIIDVMLPWAEHFAADANRSELAGGLALFRQIRDHQPELPIILFTNAHSAEYGITPGGATHFCRKVDYLPREFARFVKQLLRPNTGK